MKLIIDIPEDVYKKTIFYREFKDLNDCVTTIKALENGTPIPDNATVCDIDAIKDVQKWERVVSKAEVLEQIRADIEAIEINGQVDEHTMFIRTGEQVKQMALDIIDKHIGAEMKGQESEFRRQMRLSRGESCYIDQGITQC